MDPQSHTVTVSTRGRGLHDLTREVTDFVERLKVAAPGPRTGIVTCFIRHTSASLVIQENASPSVRRDLEAFLSRLVPDGDPLFTHVDEGDDDMPAHVKAAVLKTSEQIPVREGELALGTWQGLYVWEHRTGSHRRHVAVHVMGE